jgi:signal transduction histidine kinase
MKRVAKTYGDWDQQKVRVFEDDKIGQSQLLQGLATATYTCDKYGYIKSYNKAAVDLWGREPEIGRDLWCGSWKIYETDGITRLPLDNCPMAITLKEGIAVRGRELLVERPDGERRNVMPYPSPIFDNAGKVVEAVNMLVDITDLKKNERALKESEERYKELALNGEKKVEQRIVELTRSNDELHAINSELEQFAFVAAHDMQEPLRKIKTFSQRLEANGKVIDEDSLKYLIKITSASERMSNLINDLLIYSRIGYLDKEFEQVDLNIELNKVLNDLEIAVEEKNAAITCDNLPVIYGRGLQLNQLLYNIINNSLKFSKCTHTCKISITAQSLTGEEVKKYSLNEKQEFTDIIFTDNGIGFEQEFADSIFNIFERLEPRDKYEGTGIGLALCKKIANMHGGKIFAESTVGEGTSFHVILPLAQKI